MSYKIPFEVPDWDFDGAMGRLHATLRLGISPMLESVEDMLAELGNPDLSFRSLQVAGTNGKTSTSRYAAAILRGEGLRVGLYTSPELVSYTERLELDGSPVAEADFARGVAAAAEAGQRVNAHRADLGQRPYDITEFDLLTVGACVAFALLGAEVVVLECGMGGRWDATTAVGSIESVAVTGVGLDHTRILGDTLEKIAGEKAAIIRSGRSCVLGVGTATPTSVEDVFLRRCADEGVVPTLLRPRRLEDAVGELHPGLPRTHGDLPHASYEVLRRPGRIGGSLVFDVTTPRSRYRELSALKPVYQAANVACAVVLCEDFLGRGLDSEALFESVVCCPTPGRFDVVRADPVGLIDACHNPQSVGVFLSAVREVAPEVATRPTLLCAVLADKDVDGIVGLLAPEFPRVVVTQTRSPRALAAHELAERFRAHAAEPVGEYASCGEALAALVGDAFVACGSITLAGEVAAALR